MISQHDLKKALRYDPVTGVFTWREPRKGIKAGAVAGNDNGQGYVQIMVSGRSYLAHRLAWLYETGAFPCDELDHIHRVRNDNRIANLRLASRGQNQQNKTSAHRSNKSGFLGVSRIGQSRFVARIWAGGRVTNLGSFQSAEAAHAAYLDAKAVIHHFFPGN